MLRRGVSASSAKNSTEHLTEGLVDTIIIFRRRIKRKHQFERGPVVFPMR